jgi:hypothetical protein
MHSANKGSEDIRREGNGQFGHGFGAVCQCGRTKGEHLAVRPWPQDDTSDGFPSCAGFRKVRRGRK